MLKTGEEIAQLRQLFGNDPTLVERRFLSGGPAGVECCVLYFDGMSDADQIAQQVIRPVQEACLLTAALTLAMLTMCSASRAARSIPYRVEAGPYSVVSNATTPSTRERPVTSTRAAELGR